MEKRLTSDFVAISQKMVYVKTDVALLEVLSLPRGIPFDLNGKYYCCGYWNLLLGWIWWRSASQVILLPYRRKWCTSIRPMLRYWKVEFDREAASQVILLPFPNNSLSCKKASAVERLNGCFLSNSTRFLVFCSCIGFRIESISNISVMPYATDSFLYKAVVESSLVPWVRKQVQWNVSMDALMLLIHSCTEVSRNLVWSGE